MNQEAGKQAVHVVVVEDNPIDVEAVRRAMRVRGMDNPVHVATDGLLALGRLRTLHRFRRPFLVVLDLRLPRMDGLEFLEALRSDEDLKSAVVFVLTTSEEERDISACYAYQVAGYVLKRGDGGGVKDLLELLELYCRVIRLPVTPS